MITTTIVSALLGLLGSALPAILEIFKSRQETANAIKLEEARNEAARVNSKLKLDQLNLEADIAETKSIYDSDAALDGGKFVNSFRAIIRPLITMVFFLVFIFVKVYAFYYGIQVQGLDVINMLPIIWDDETASLFAVTMGFWFGNRALDRKLVLIKK